MNNVPEIRDIDAAMLTGLVRQALGSSTAEIRHWEHHLVASLPWYQQLILHRYVVRLLTPRQRGQFLIEPVIGFPKLWWRLLRDSRSFLRLAVSPPVP